MNKIFRYSIAGAIALTQSVAMEITENTIIKSGEAFNWQGETEITIPAGKSLNIAGKMNGPGSPATIYLDGTFEAESGATLDLKNVTIKSKFLEDYPDLKQQETWDGVPVYQDSSGNFPKFEDAFYKPLTGQRLKVLNKLAGYNDWYEVAVLDEQSTDEDIQATDKIKELRQNLENLQQQIDDFNNAMDNLNGSDIATFAALNAQLAQAAIMYSNENPYVNIDPNAKWVADFYAGKAQTRANESRESAITDAHREPFAFSFALDAFCWAYLSWKIVGEYDSTELSTKIKEIFEKNAVGEGEIANKNFNSEILGFCTEKHSNNHNGIEYYTHIHCDRVGDFTTVEDGTGGYDGLYWTYYSKENIYKAGPATDYNYYYQYIPNEQCFQADMDQNSSITYPEHWTLSVKTLQPMITPIINALPTVEDSKSNQELQQLTARYYSTTPLSTDEEVTDQIAYIIASQSTINLSKFRTIPILLNSDSVESSKDPLNLTSKVQNLDIESCLTVHLPFNSKFNTTTLGSGIWNVTYQTLLTGATKNFEIGDDNVLTYTLSGGTEIGDYETNTDLQITLNPKKTKKNRPHF